MRVFVTGATGFIGSAVVRELLHAGHDVVGLARSDAGASALAEAGASVHRGSLEDADSLRRGAGASDGVIHLGFNHDFSRFKENSEMDRRAIEALGSQLAGSTRPLVVTSGIGLLPQGRLLTEADRPSPASANPRVASEEAARQVADRGVRTSVVRLPPSVHGDGDHAFIPMLIGIARERRASAYIGDGSNRWPAVHRDDAAKLFRLAFETSAEEAYYHGVAEEGVPFRDIAAVIARRLSVPLVSVNQDEKAAHFGWFTHFAEMDVPSSNEQTRRLLSWQPAKPGLIEDIDRPSYFAG